MKNRIRSILIGNSILSKGFRFLFRVVKHSHIKSRGKNQIVNKGLLTETNIELYGSGNSVIICSEVRLFNSSIIIRGNNNVVKIDESSVLHGTVICIEDDKNTIHIGSHTSVSSRYHKSVITALEGTSITIGTNCMLSDSITIRSSDAHILLSDGKRCNPAKDVTIGNHIWICANAYISKGVKIADNTIIGSYSVVTKSVENEYCVVAGNPAKTVKININWDKERAKR